MALALRGMVKLPTAKDDDEGVGTGKVDFAFDGIVSKEINQRVELSGFGGCIFRGDPDDFDLSDGFRWGFGAGFPTRRRICASRRNSTASSTSMIRSPTPGTGLIGDDGSLPPSITTLTTRRTSPRRADVAGKNWFAGAGVNWNFEVDGRSDSARSRMASGDGVRLPAPHRLSPRRARLHAAAAATVAAAPAATPARATSADGDGALRTLHGGSGQDVDRDGRRERPRRRRLTYRWTAPTGTLTTATARQTPWTAPNQEGPVQLTVQVNDGKGGTADSSVTIQVIRPAVKEIVFEDVHFDFDRYSLRPEATRALDEAIKSLQDNPALRIEIEGHTCNIGTAEYNLALGERRANAVRDYLTSRGIGADRLRTVSYGEERPKHDNSREETPAAESACRDGGARPAIG